MTDTPHPLVRFESTDMPLTQSEHVVGYAVHDSDNVRIGEVDDLIVDLDSGRVRFLIVGDGGLLGVGRSRYLVPVDVVAEVIADSATPTIFLSVSGVRVDASPWDDQADPANYAATYRHFDCEPYWSNGYVERDWTATSV